MRLFMPNLLIVEPGALEYPLGQEIYERFRGTNVEVRVTKSHNRITGLPGQTAREKYAAAKRTLVLGVRKTLEFETSKPSADYAIPLITGCPGHCTYCYLQTTLGPRPVNRVYVNLDEIFARARDYIAQKAPDLTYFEGACTSDPLSLEHITGTLRRTIAFFGTVRDGRFRFVTKYDNVEGLLDAAHHGHTRIRFSLNTEDVIQKWELGTARLDERLTAAAKVAGAGYPTGFILAPIFLEGDWQAGYGDLLHKLHQYLSRVDFDPERADLTFELITHRYTPKAKALITERFPETDLPMDETERRWKYGQFGYGKYLYPKEPMDAAAEFFRAEIGRLFPRAAVQYLV